MRNIFPLLVCIVCAALVACPATSSPSDAGPDTAADARSSVLPACGTTPEERCAPTGACLMGEMRCARESGNCSCEPAACPTDPVRGERCDASLAGILCDAGFEYPGITCRPIEDHFEWRYTEFDVPGCTEVNFTRGGLGGPGHPWLCPTPSDIRVGERCCYLPRHLNNLVPAATCPDSSGATRECDILSSRWR